MLSKQQRAAIRARCEAATPGPYQCRRGDADEGEFYIIAQDDDRRFICVPHSQVDPTRGGPAADMALLTHVADDLPALLTDYEALLAVHERLVAAVEEFDKTWADPDDPKYLNHDHPETEYTEMVMAHLTQGFERHLTACRALRAAMAEARAHATEEGSGGTE